MQPFFDIVGSRYLIPEDDSDVFAFTEPMRQQVRGGDIRRHPSTDEKKIKRRGSLDDHPLTGGAS